MSEDDLLAGFREFRPLYGQCKFRNCRHENEPGCAVIHALENGLILPERFNNFLKLRESLGELVVKVAALRIDRTTSYCLPGHVILGHGAGISSNQLPSEGFQVILILDGLSRQARFGVGGIFGDLTLRFLV